MTPTSSGTQYAATGRSDHLIAKAANDNSAHKQRAKVENGLNGPPGWNQECTPSLRTLNQFTSIAGGAGVPW